MKGKLAGQGNPPIDLVQVGSGENVKNAQAVVVMGSDGEPINIPKKHTFHDEVTTIGNGIDFVNIGYKSLRVMISSNIAPATRNINFLAAIGTTFVALNGFKETALTSGISSSGIGTEVWVFDIEGYETVRMDLTALTGTNADTSVVGVSTC